MMLPFHRKEKLDDVKPHSFPYRFPRPAMFSNHRRRFSPRKIHIVGFIILFLIVWLLLRRGERPHRYKSPYAVGSRYIGTEDVRPIVDITIQECTRWRWFEKQSKCTALLRNGWEISGGDLLLDEGKHRVHLFVKRISRQDEQRTPVVTDIQISWERPAVGSSWESRPGGIWINRGFIQDIKEAVTAVDFIHGRGIREIRRGRQFVQGGYLHLGQGINLSFRVGLPPAREFPKLKVTNLNTFKVLQVAGIECS